MFGNLESIARDWQYYLPALIIAFTIHEFSHAYVSYKLGDRGVKEDGRLSLNPAVHIDPLGLLFLFVTGFGWAKPVVIRPSYYRNPVRDTMLVALAGPVSNFILAALAIILNMLFKETIFAFFFTYLWIINIGLGIFNLIPVPPLDGSRIMSYFMDADDYQDYLEKRWIGWILLIMILTTGFMGHILNPIYTFLINFIY
jgi:Zn-dependent proteases